MHPTIKELEIHKMNSYPGIIQGLIYHNSAGSAECPAFPRGCHFLTGFPKVYPQEKQGMGNVNTGIVLVFENVGHCRAAGVFRSTATLGVLQIRVSSPTRRDPVATLTEDKKIVPHRIVLKLSGRWNLGENSSPAAWGIARRPASCRFGL